MDRAEAEASLRVLVAVARADGSLSTDEERVIELAAEHERERIVLADARDVDLDAELAKIRSKDARRLTLKAALAIAAIDGETCAAEHAVLVRIHAALGGDDVPALRVVEDDAAERMRAVKQRLDASTDAFMHAVARASRGGKVDPAEYERLLGDLEAEKHALVEASLEGRLSVVPRR